MGFAPLGEITRVLFNIVLIVIFDRELAQISPRISFVRFLHEVYIFTRGNDEVIFDEEVGYAITVSSLLVNFTKSHSYFSPHAPAWLKRRHGRIFGMNEGTYPFKYQGIPLKVGSLNKDVDPRWMTVFGAELSRGNISMDGLTPKQRSLTSAVWKAISCEWSLVSNNVGTHSRNSQSSSLGFGTAW